MAQAIERPTIFRLSALFTDPVVRSAFERAERDNPPAPVAVESRPRSPVLNGSEAVSELELA